MRSERALSAIVLALATLAAAGASVGLAIPLAMLPADRLQVLLAMNFIPPEGGRSMLLGWLVAGAGLATAPALVLFARRGFAAEPALSRAAALASPLLVSALVPQVRVVQFWVDRPLRFLVLLALAVVALERLLARSLAAVPPAWRRRANDVLGTIEDDRGEKLSLIVVLLASATYAYYAGRFTLYRHWRLESAGYDLGIQDNLMWNAMHGDFFRTPLVFPNGESFLSHHADLLSVLFVPIYALWPGAELLLVLQAIAIGFAAVPLYAFARALLPRRTALVIALTYLLYAPVHGANSYDFHWLPFSIGLLFALFWALATGRFYAAAAFSILALLVREDVSIGLAALGAFLVVTGARPRWGLGAAVAATAWFFSLKLGVMEAVGGAEFSYHYADLIAPGEKGFGGVIRTALLNPSFLVASLLEQKKLVYALHLFAPLAFVPLRRLPFVLLMVPGFIVTLLTTKLDPAISISFQYVSHWIPYLFGACVLYLHVSKEPSARRATLLAIVLGVVAHSYPFGAALQHQTFVAGFSRSTFGFSQEDRARLERFRAVVAEIPAGASVAATEPEVPHLSTRRLIYTLKWGYRAAEYVLVDRESGAYRDPNALIDEILRTGKYHRVAENGEFVLFGQTGAIGG